MTFLGYPHRFMSPISPSRFLPKICFILANNKDTLLTLLSHLRGRKMGRAPLNNNKVSTKQKFGYNRNINNVHAKEGVTTGSSKTYVHSVKVKNMFRALECDSKSSIVLDDECLFSKDFSKDLLGRVKDFVTLPNLKIVLKNEESYRWRLKAFPSNYGLIILLNGLPLSRESYWTLMIRKRKVFILKVPGWVPEFVDDFDDDDELDNGFKDGDAKVQDGGRCGNDSDDVEVPETMFEESLEQKVNQSKDPFAPIDEINAMRNVMIKLKFLKRKIHEWLNDNRNKSKSVSDQLKEELQKLDAAIDKGIEFDDIINKRLEVLNSIQHLDKIKAMDVAQKPKIKWAIKGDENTRPISLIGSMYKIIAKILANRLVGVLRDIVNEVQSAFITERQILDGPFILNEVIQWYKLKNKQSLIFKVDFEKAYDSVRWDFLDDVLKKFGFGNKWCAWIQSCLRSSRGSIIINGSPVIEFQFFKGIKQGDPLPPFLFILIMENLHLSFQRVVDVGMFKGINLSPLVNLSHIFYADDAVFVGQWCDGNINTLVHVLECFFHVSGLRINMCKSKIIGVNVGDEKAKKCLETCLGCKLRRRLSIRHELNNNKASWVKWKSLLASKEKGGLGVLSLYALNRALMMKWVWRFYSQKESLWERVIKAIYNDDEQVGKVSRAGSRSCWRNIVNEVRILSNQCIKVLDYMRIKLGNGESTAFWDDNWIGGKVLKYSFPPIYALETEKEVTVNSKMSDTRLENSLRRSIRGSVEQVQFSELSDMLQSFSLMPYSDRWVWSLEGSAEFSVASIQNIIDDNRLLTVDTRTLWIKYVLIKVNVLAWKIKIEALSTRFNISRRGIDIDSILCPIYRMSLSVIMKCTAALRQLAYDTTPDAFDEYLQMSSNNDINVLDNSSLFDDLLDDKALFRHKPELTETVKLEDPPLGDETITTNSRIITNLNSKPVSGSQELNPSKGQLVINASIDQQRKRFRGKIEKVSLVGSRGNGNINLAPTLKNEYQGDVSSSQQKRNTHSTAESKFDSMILVSCLRCYLHVLVKETYPKCPKCGKRDCLLDIFR
nr:RNA-directed DNA polymerase, eukaryota, reverse transcriptase zinc-binding domain protein [Tanacetum cinerariifolium]